MAVAADFPLPFSHKNKNTAFSSEGTVRPRLPGGLFFSAHFSGLKQGIGKGKNKKCEEALIIDGGAATLGSGVAGTGGARAAATAAAD